MPMHTWCTASKLFAEIQAQSAHGPYKGIRNSIQVSVRMPNAIQRSPADQLTSQMNFAEATSPLLEHLLSIARRILGNDEAAWDAVQEALVSMWREDVMPSHIGSWLASTVAHRSLHLARCRSRRRRHELQAGFQHCQRIDRGDPANQMDGEELGCILERALAQIAPDQRVVLVLHVVEQMNYESIASTLRIPIGTVRSRLNRARRALRELLSRSLPEEYCVRHPARPSH